MMIGQAEEEYRMIKEQQTIDSVTTVKEIVEQLAMTMPVTDMHTHLFSADFGDFFAVGDR